MTLAPLVAAVLTATNHADALVAYRQLRDAQRSTPLTAAERAWLDARRLPMAVHLGNLNSRDPSHRAPIPAPAPRVLVLS